MSRWPQVQLKRVLAADPQYGASESGVLNADDSWPRYVRITDIGDNDALRDEIKRLAPKSAEGFMLRDEDLLFARSGATVGKAFMYRSSMGPCAYAGYLIRFRLSADVAHPRFVRHWADSSLYWAQIAAGSVQATIENVNAERYKRLVLPLPPLSEQEQIAAFLDAETSRIDLLIAEYQNQIKVVGEQLSGTVFGLLQQSNPNQTDLTLRTDICSWRLKVLPVAIQTGPFGSQLHEADYVDDGWPVVNPANLVGNQIEANRGMCISDEKREELGQHVLGSGDLVLGRRGEMGRCGLVTEAEIGWVCGTGSMRLRVDPSALAPAFVFEWLTSPFASNFLRAHSVGTTMDNLNESLLGSLPVWVPPLAEQHAVVAEIRTARKRAFELRDTCESQIRSLRELRQAIITTAVSEGIEACEATA